MPADFLDAHDLHVHVPAGAIPKDGPSAGVTMATAILSALRRQPVREDVAMTGEITLSGLVLPVGGIREKALAARRQGIRTFVLPEQNTADLSELPEELQKDMTFVPAGTLDDVLKVALPTGAAGPVAGAGVTPRWLRRLFNVYPPYLGAGVRVARFDDDSRFARVEMPLRWYNRNYVGTHFGGSLYSMVDPFLMIMLMHEPRARLPSSGTRPAASSSSRPAAGRSGPSSR